MVVQGCLTIGDGRFRLGLWGMRSLVDRRLRMTAPHYLKDVIINLNLNLTNQSTEHDHVTDLVHIFVYRCVGRQLRPRSVT